MAARHRRQYRLRKARRAATEAMVRQAFKPWLDDEARRAWPPVLNSGGKIWIYRQYPILLPTESTFKIAVDFGHKSTDYSTPGIMVKVNLLGTYKTLVEVA